jgi:hypothetical protein
MLAVAFGTLSATNGSIAGGNQITLTAPSAPFTSTTATYFSTSQCTGTYASGNITATVSKVSTSVLTVTVPKTLTVATPYYICIYSGTTVGTSPLVGRSDVTYAGYTATLPTVTLVPTNGSSGNPDTKAITITSAPDTILGSAPATLFARNSCPGTYPSSVSSTVEPFDGATTKISTAKVAVTVPATVVVGPNDATTPWNTCLYASTSPGAALIAMPGVFTVAPVLDVSSATLDPDSGPAQGGIRISIDGLDGIPTAAGALVQASLGGSPLTNITVIDNTEISGTTSMHGAGVVDLTVTTAAGSQTLAAAFTYTYGVTVTPNTAAPNTTPVLDITGAGFTGLSFANACPSGTCAVVAANKSYVLLTNNAWYGQTFPASPATGLASPWLSGAPPTALCNNVLPISDAEIICTLDLAKEVASASAADATSVITTTTNAGDGVTPGTYTITVVNDGDDINDGEFSVVSSGSTFTVAPF